MKKILFVKGSDLSILWVDDGNSTIKPEWWVYTKFPEDKGIYVWEEGVGVREPTNKEWFSIFKNENPFLVPESEKIITSEWVKERKDKAA